MKNEHVGRAGRWPAGPPAAGRSPASRRWTGRRAAGAPLLLALFLALPAFATITSSSLTGTVTIGGKPAAGVTVTVASRTTTTNAHGRYWVNALPPGVYDVTFSLPAHTTLTKRAVLELARVARADGVLEPNPDEDSTTSTATTVSVAETIFPTTHFDDRALDRLPTGRLGSAFLAPDSRFANTIIDGVPDGAVPSEEMVEQITAVNGVSPVEWETQFGSPIALRTRSGREEFFFTLRDTVTNDDDLQHFGEATAGGRIVPQRLWFFAGAWGGEQSASAPDLEGVLAKVDAQFGGAHHLGLSYSDTLQVFFTTPLDYDTAALRYTGVAGPRFTTEVVAARTENTDFYSGRASYNLGDHVLTAGYTDAGAGAVFASDRWSYARWNVYAGLRHEDGELAPRVAVSYDLHGNGARAIVATWGEYAQPGLGGQPFRVTSLGFASALGNGGSARADFLRRESGSFWQHDFLLDARYRLFDRFEAGGTYTLTNRVESPSPFLYPEQTANVWLGAELPLGNHEFGMTVLQHYLEASRFSEAPTDLALRYSIPFTRVGLLLAFDMTNVFDNPDGISLFPPRDYRFWVRVRI